MSKRQKSVVTKTSKKYLKVCPKCGNTDISTDYSIPAAWDYGAPSNFICNNCKFSGSLFPEIKAADKEIIKSKIHKEGIIKSNELAKIDFGKGFAKGVGKVLGPFFTIMFLIIFILGISNGNITIIFASSLPLAIGILFIYSGFFNKENS